MAVYFFDSSAVVKRYVREPGSAWIVTLCDPIIEHHIYIARITGVEVVSAITRRARHGDIAASDAIAALAQLRQDLAAVYRSVEITSALVGRAMALAETYALRGYDAVQLAAAVEVNVRGLSLELPPVTCISADRALNSAAVTEGLAVDDPNVH